MTDASSILPAGALLQGGKYRIIRALGQGGFGITYLAEQTGLGMKVAVKEFFLKGSCQRNTNTSRVSVPIADNQDLVSKCLRKFKSEARKIASLSNDHIVSIIDIFDENETSYYVMKYLEGGSLADRIRHAPMSEKDALSVIGEIADALKSIHANNLLHLDIKPANILFDSHNRAVLIDFGISKYVDNPKDTTTISSLVGFSRGFAPLEQVNADVDSLSAASDIYSLGATLYNLVVGITPPDASSVMEMGLPAFPAGISGEVQTAIMKSMSPSRRDRPQDINAFLELLPEESESDESDITVIPGPPGPSPDPDKRRILIRLAIVFLIGILIPVAISLLVKPDKTGEREQIERLNNENLTLSMKNDSLQVELNGVKSQVSSLIQTKNEMQKQINDFKSTNATQATQIKTLQNTNDELRRERDLYKTDADKWRRHIQVSNGR